MKIGILTFHYPWNYGAVLQAYASVQINKLLKILIFSIYLTFIWIFKLTFWENIYKYLDLG